VFSELLLFLERWMFPTEGGRSLLLTCGEKSSGQQYVESFAEALPMLVPAFVGFCGARISVQPRDGDINTIPRVEGASIDIDAGLDLGKHLAKALSKKIEGLGAVPVVITTGGKGYAVRLFLDKQYASIGDAEYKALVKNLASMVPELGTIEILHRKALIRIPYTRHEETGNLVLVYDYMREEFVKDPAEALNLLERAIEHPLPYYKELLEGEEEAHQPPAPPPPKPSGAAPKAYEYIERLMQATGLQDCRTRFAILIGRYLYTIRGWSKEEARKFVEQWLKANGSKKRQALYAIKEIKPPTLERLLKEKAYGPIDFSDCIPILQQLLAKS